MQVIKYRGRYVELTSFQAFNSNQREYIENQYEENKAREKFGRIAITDWFGRARNNKRFSKDLGLDEKCLARRFKRCDECIYYEYCVPEEHDFL